ncbi:hypothetical protein AKJ16_DCAP00053 [Drosera capensis]
MKATQSTARSFEVREKGGKWVSSPIDYRELIPDVLVRCQIPYHIARWKGLSIAELTHRQFVTFTSLA